MVILEERIHSHIVSVWRESKKFFTIGGREGMLLLTDSRLMFVHKTASKMRWWRAIVDRQTVMFIKSKNTMVLNDGYDEESLREDMQNEKNMIISFNNIRKIYFKEEKWGSVLYVEYETDGERKKYAFSIVQDWVKYPMKDPTGFMRVDWEPFVNFIKERQMLVE